MIVLINAISIKEGGSLVVLRNLLRHLSALDERVQWHVAANARIRGMAELSLPRVTAHFFDASGRSPLHIQWWDNQTLPGLLERVGAELLFSLTNYLPDRTICCPSLLLEQHAGYFSPFFDQRMQATLSPWAPGLSRLQRDAVQPRLEGAGLGGRGAAEVLDEARRSAAGA